jgi:peptidoglycan/LPS O-acetylase OafA/YrhL
MQQALPEYKIGKLGSSLNSDEMTAGQVAEASPLHRSFGLDAARAFAICLVLIAHFSHKNFDSLGFWGVELFFALSGYLIGQILWRNYSQVNNWTRHHITNFWYRRWWRTLPNYYLFLLVLLFQQWQNNKVPSLAEISNFLWFGQDLFERNYGFYSQSWSLCIEEWFYLLFPLVLFAFSRLGLKPKPAFLLVLLTFFVGSAIVRSSVLDLKVMLATREITLGRLDAIAFGVAMSYLQSTIELDIKKRILLSLVGIVLLLISISAVYSAGYTTLRGYWPLVNVPLGFALMLPLISLWQMPNGYLKYAALGVKNISLWSYSIYLSHAPIMWIFYQWLDNQRGSFYGNLLSKVLGLATTLLVSSLLYKFFEVPLTKYRPAELKA